MSCCMLMVSLSNIIHSTTCTDMNDSTRDWLAGTRNHGRQCRLGGVVREAERRQPGTVLVGTQHVEKCHEVILV
jgi:hypothetical protein